MIFFKAGRFFELKNVLPLFQSRRKLTHSKLGCKLLLVITFSQFPCSYSQQIPKNVYGLPVITTIKAYQNSLKASDNKRIVPLKNYVEPLITEWKYATKDNFTHKGLYKSPQAYVRLKAAENLQKVEAELAKKGLGLKFFDAYRPYNITVEMWKVVPDERYAANPAKGSGHNRGAAVDVTLINLTTKMELAMPTPFDDFTEKAHHDYMNLPKEVLENRQLLKSTMEKYGFVALDTEWWHYSLPNAASNYELLDLSFKEMKRITEE